MTVPSYMESFAEIAHRIATGGPQARPTTYKGITFRSRLEVRFAWHLDAIGEQWRYEPRAYGPKGRGYLPDFEVYGLPQPTFIEVKPTAQEVPDAARKMEVIWDTHPDALLIVACEQGWVFRCCLRGGTWEGWSERWTI